MSALQNQSRSDSPGEGWFACGSSGDGYQGDTGLIAQGQTVDLSAVFQHYGIHLNRYCRSISCPFSSHQDRSPSFYFYPDTNSFYCFGCKKSGGPVQFVSLFRHVSREEAARQLLNNFEFEEIDSFGLSESREREDLHLKFSAIVRNFHQKHRGEEAFQMAEKMTRIFDDACRRNSLEIEGLRRIIQRLEEMLTAYED